MNNMRDHIMAHIVVSKFSWLGFSMSRVGLSDRHRHAQAHIITGMLSANVCFGNRKLHKPIINEHFFAHKNVTKARFGNNNYRTL